MFDGGSLQVSPTPLSLIDVIYLIVCMQCSLHGPNIARLLAVFHLVLPARFIASNNRSDSNCSHRQQDGHVSTSKKLQLIDGISSFSTTTLNFSYESPAGNRGLSCVRAAGLHRSIASHIGSSETGYHFLLAVR